MSAEVLKVINIFRAGTHTSMRGRTLTYTPKLLEHTALMYDPERYPAPLCFGHPENNQPVFGWVKKLFARGAELFAEASFSDSLIDLGKKGLVNSVSAAFSIQGMRDEQTPVLLQLLHVGFLEPGRRPGVKGLRKVEFGQSLPVSEIVFAQADEARAEFSASVLGFSIEPGAIVRADRARLHARAIEYRRACPALSYGEAVRLVGSINL